MEAPPSPAHLAVANRQAAKHSSAVAMMSDELSLLSPSIPVLDASKDPDSENYRKGDRLTLRVQSVSGVGFHVWIDGYGQRAIETKIPELSLAFTETSDLTRDPVEVGLRGAPQRVDFKITVSAYDNHLLPAITRSGEVSPYSDLRARPRCSSLGSFEFHPRSVPVGSCPRNRLHLQRSCRVELE